MVIRIVVDEGLPDLSGLIRRETLAEVMAITQPNDRELDQWRRVGTPFGPSYALTPVATPERDLGVLYVSPGVKKMFYATTRDLSIEPTT